MRLLWLHTLFIWGRPAIAKVRQPYRVRVRVRDRVRVRVRFRVRVKADLCDGGPEPFI